MSDNDTQSAIDYAVAHREAFLSQFETFLRFPSVSTDPAFAEHLLAAADWLVEHMRSIGLENCRALASAGHPVVYGDWLHAGPDRPTVLVYAHYDVQPVDPITLWQTPPFEPTMRDGRLYARGVFDDKSNVILNLKAIESMLATSGALPVNVKLFFEGEEEIGSPNMASFVSDHAEGLSADVLLICDGSSPVDNPRITTATRGLVGGEVVVTGPTRDLHSGKFGGGIHNPAHMVGQIIAALHDNEGRVQIPGFYDNVRPLSPHARAGLLSLDEHTRQEHQAESGAPALWGAPEYAYVERVTAQPTCDVNGITSGYQGEGGKTIIPSQASFKVTMRLVPDQEPEDIELKFRKFISRFECDTLDIQVRMRAASPPAEILTEGPVIDAISDAFEATWGKRPILERSGGTIAIINMFADELKIPITIPGYTSGDAIHSPNEYLHLEGFFRSIGTAIHVFHNLARLTVGGE